MKIVCYHVESVQTPFFDELRKKNWNGKTLKMQLKQRFFQNKTGCYVSYGVPLLLEIDENTYWKDLSTKLNQILEQDNIDVFN